MYPRNAASPPRIAIGAVVQISDGAVQTSGVSVAVRPNGGNESAGGGTVSYGGSSGIVYYAPTQAETDYTDFVVTAYKTGCIPVAATIVTSASATAGHTVAEDVILAASQPNYAPAKAGDQMDLVDAPNATAVTAIAVRIEQAILDDEDGRAILEAIVGAIGNQNVDEIALVAAIRVDIERSGGMLESRQPTIWSAANATVNLSGTTIKAVTDAVVIDVSELNTHLLDIKGTGFQKDTHSLPQCVTDESATGSGARTVTITVTDGTDPLQNANVRLTEGANSYQGVTNVSGQIVFNVDDATYVVSITKSGYTYAGTTLVVDGTEAQTYALTLLTITPSEPGTTSAFAVVYDTAGDPVEDVTITCTLQRLPGTGVIGDNNRYTVDSDENGLVVFVNRIKGATYRFKRDNGEEYLMTIPTTAGSTYELPSFVG